MLLKILFTHKMSNVRFERRQLLIIPENTIVVHQKKKLPNTTVCNCIITYYCLCRSISMFCYFYCGFLKYVNHFWICPFKIWSFVFMMFVQPFIQLYIQNVKLPVSYIISYTLIIRMKCNFSRCFE